LRTEKHFPSAMAEPGMVFPLDIPGVKTPQVFLPHNLVFFCQDWKNRDKNKKGLGYFMPG
jgi:hypothetical protein